MMQKMGKYVVEVYFDPDTGDVDVRYEVEFEPHLQEMKGALSRHEKIEALALRSHANRSVTNFFLFVRDPDSNLEAIKGDTL